MNVAYAVGVISGFINGALNSTLATYEFPQAYPRSDGPLTVLRYGVALNDYKGRDADGDAPGVRLWDEKSQFIGKNTDSKHIKEGSYVDVIVRDTSVGQPTYAVLTANNNAICLSYIRMVWPDGQNWGWVGNWARTCGKSWYHANIVLDGKPVECTWMDGNGDAPGDITGLQIHFPDFNDKGRGYDPDPQWYCDRRERLEFRQERELHEVITYHEPPRSSTDEMAEWDAFLDYVNETSDLLKTRSNVLPALVGKQIVKSNLDSHTATSLCKSETSRGPDFASLAEGKFCDMETKTLWPICKSQEDESCFDNDNHLMRGVKRSGKRTGRAVTWPRNYTKITIWGDSVEAI